MPRDDFGHGDRGGGSLHTAATASVPGFMSAADKAKSDSITVANLVTLTGSQVLTNKSISGATNTLSAIGMGSLAPVYFRVGNSSGTSILDNGTFQQVGWNVEDFDSHAAFASNVFTVPSGQAGLYVFFAQGLFTITAGSTSTRLTLTRNGSAFSGHAADGVTAFTSLVVSGMSSLSVGDTVGVSAFQDNATNVAQSFGGNSTNAYFMGWRIA